MYQEVATRNSATTREILALEPGLNRTSPLRSSKKFAKKLQ
jgi:hypothetical protein